MTYYYTPGQDIKYEVESLDEGLKIIIYLDFSEETRKYHNRAKPFASHCLIQIFDNDDTLIDSNLIINPHKGKSKTYLASF